jgi:DNA-binding transcriptional LysR family regulator
MFRFALFRLTLVGLLSAAASFPASAQSWPARPVHLVLSQPPGSSPDILARLVADRLGKRWDRPVVVENRPGGQLTLRKYLDASHAIVSPEGRSHDLFERELQRRGCVRRVRLEIPHYLSLPAIIAASDLVATVPRDIGLAFEKLAKLRLLEPPFNVSFDVKQYWHERAHKDPVNVWLRQMIHELFHD